VQPIGATSPDTVDFLLEHQVTPLVESKRGRLVLHGSAVALGGCAIAVVGDSGAGKSTLAGSFAVSGAPFLTDDALYIRRDGDGYVAEPSRATLRLWRDSREHLVGNHFLVAPALAHTSKERLFASAELPHYGHAISLPAIYCLREDCESARDITFTRLSQAEAALEMVRNSFLLDIESRDDVSSHFSGFAAVAQTIPCFGLAYPRRYERLPEVRAAIVAHIAELKR
jgi:hypothetical protein